MGDWLKLLIPLIVVAVWILSHLASGKQNQKRPAPPRPLPPQDSDDGSRPQRAARELEQFLEEVRRKKQEAEEKSQPEPVQVAQEVQRPKSLPPPLPPRQEPRTIEQRRRSVPVGAKRSQRPLDAVIVLEPLPATPVSVALGEGMHSVAMPKPGVEIPQAPQANQALPPPPAAPQALNRPEALPSKTRQTQAMKLVRELLKNRQTLRAAFLLREVFDPPLSKRRR